MKIFKRLLSAAIVIALVVSTMCTTFAAFDPEDFNAYANADLIEKYGECTTDYKDHNTHPNHKKSEEIFRSQILDTIADIACKKVILDPTSTSDITTAFIQKIYSPENKAYFEKQFESAEDPTLSYWNQWKRCNKVLCAIAEVDVVTYLINHNENSKYIKDNFESIKTEVFDAANLYIDSMPISDLAKSEMKETLAKTSVSFYGINKDAAVIFNELDKDIFSKTIALQNETFIDNLKQLPNTLSSRPPFKIWDDEIYRFNAYAFCDSQEIHIAPSVALNFFNNNMDNNISSIKFTLAHELGHVWNTCYVELTSKSLFLCDIRYSYSLYKPEQENQLLKDRLDDLVLFGVNRQHIFKLSENDILFLNQNSQKILDAFNINTGVQISESELLYIKAAWATDHDPFLADRLISERKWLNGEGKLVDVKLDGLSLLNEAAADNFALESLTRYAKASNQDLYPIFYSFARTNWSLLSSTLILVDEHPVGKYRINLGLNLCENYREWASQQNG